MMNQIDFALVSGIISLAAYGLYIYTIWFGDTRPSKSSWWILTVVWSVLLLSSISLSSEGTLVEKFQTLPGGWLSLSYILGSLIIAISTIWRGASEKWGTLDYWCAGSALLALILYFVIHEPFWALVLSLVADVFGIIPTIKNAYVHPDKEDITAWTLESIASIIGLLAITGWFASYESISQWSPVVYLVIVNVIITLLICRKFFKQKTLS